ncbi:hypothetical protein JW948_02550 [bacterium]|nr:hypothetical protein [bacterium]
MKLTWNTPVPGLLVGISGNQLDFNWDLKANVDMVVLTGDPANPYFPMSQTVPITGDYVITTRNAFGEFQWDKLTLAGEYRQFDIDGDVELGLIQSHTKEPREMYYGMGSYQFNNRLALSAYYSVFYQNADDKEGDIKVAAGQPAHTGWQKDLCFTGRLDVTDNWVVKMEYHKINGTGQVYGMHNPDGLKEDWSMIVVKNTFHY